MNLHTEQTTNEQESQIGQDRFINATATNIANQAVIENSNVETNNIVSTQNRLLSLKQKSQTFSASELDSNNIGLPNLTNAGSGAINESLFDLPYSNALVQPELAVNEHQDFPSFPVFDLGTTPDAGFDLPDITSTKDNLDKPNSVVDSNLFPGNFNISQTPPDFTEFNSDYFSTASDTNPETVNATEQSKPEIVVLEKPLVRVSQSASSVSVFDAKPAETLNFDELEGTSTSVFDLIKAQIKAYKSSLTSTHLLEKELNNLLPKIEVSDR